MITFKKDNIEYKVTGITPTRIYFETTFDKVAESMDREEFMQKRAQGDIKVTENSEFWIKCQTLPIIYSEHRKEI